MSTSIANVFIVISLSLVVLIGSARTQTDIILRDSPWRPASLIPLDRRSKHRKKILLDPNELPERFDTLRRRHGALIVPSHRQVTVSRHMLGSRLELGRHAPKLLRKLHIGVVLLLGVVIGDIERPLLHFEILSHCGGEVGELGWKRGMLGQPFSTGRLLHGPSPLYLH